MRASRLQASRRALIAVLVAVAVAGAMAGCGGPAAPVSGADVSGSWPVAGYDIGDTRDAAGAHIIGPGNVSRLTTAWSVTAAGSVRTPTVDGGVVYFPDSGGKLWAVSAATGDVLWSDEVSGYIGIPGAISRTSPAIYRNELVLGDASYQTLLGDTRPLSGAYVFAVAKRTGRLEWRTKVDSHPTAIITGSPVIYQGVVYEGVSSYEEVLAPKPGYHCCTFRGSVVALDAMTGRLLWKTYTMPQGYSGGSVWASTPAIDPAAGLLYVGTGNNYSVPSGVCTAPGETGCTPPAAGDHVDSVLALDLMSGAVRWYKSTVTGDVFNEACRQLSGGGCGQDFDFGSGPSLFRLPSGRQLLGIGQKSGIYWALDPATGAVAWKTMAGPGSGNGGIELGSAVAGGRIYAAIGNFYGKPYQITSAGGRTTTTSGGFWAALDAATGKILWQTADPQQAADLGFVTTANGLVYAGSTAQNGDDMYVLNAATGTILWRFAVGGPVVSGAAIAGGSVYWGSGYLTATRCHNGSLAIKACQGSGNKIYAFRLART
jgi:outer membrane protein assembly factor BamB